VWGYHHVKQKCFGLSRFVYQRYRKTTWHFVKKKAKIISKRLRLYHISIFPKLPIYSENWRKICAIKQKNRLHTCLDSDKVLHELWKIFWICDCFFRYIFKAMPSEPFQKTFFAGRRKFGCCSCRRIIYLMMVWPRNLSLDFDG